MFSFVNLSVGTAIPGIDIIYAQENDRMAKLARFLWITAVLFTEFSIFPIAIQSFIAYYNSNRSADSFQLLFLAVIPWDWKTPIGYFAVVCAQSMWIHCGIFLKICSLPLFAGFCGLFQAFALDIEQSLKEINRKFLNDEQRSGNGEIIKALENIVQFHATAKGFVITGVLIGAEFSTRSSITDLHPTLSVGYGIVGWWSVGNRLVVGFRSNLQALVII